MKKILLHYLEKDSHKTIIHPNHYEKKNRFLLWLLNMILGILNLFNFLKFFLVYFYLLILNLFKKKITDKLNHLCEPSKEK